MQLNQTSNIHFEHACEKINVFIENEINKQLSLVITYHKTLLK